MVNLVRKDPKVIVVLKALVDRRETKVIRVDMGKRVNSEGGVNVERGDLRVILDLRVKLEIVDPLDRVVILDRVVPLEIWENVVLWVPVAK